MFFQCRGDLGLFGGDRQFRIGIRVQFFRKPGKRMGGKIFQLTAEFFQFGTGERIGGSHPGGDSGTVAQKKLSEKSGRFPAQGVIRHFRAIHHICRVPAEVLAGRGCLPLLLIGFGRSVLSQRP